MMHSPIGIMMRKAEGEGWNPTSIMKWGSGRSDVNDASFALHLQPNSIVLDLFSCSPHSWCHGPCGTSPTICLHVHMGNVFFFKKKKKWWWMIWGVSPNHVLSLVMTSATMVAGYGHFHPWVQLLGGLQMNINGFHQTLRFSHQRGSVDDCWTQPPLHWWLCLKAIRGDLASSLRSTYEPQVFVSNPCHGIKKIWILWSHGHQSS